MNIVKLLMPQYFLAVMIAAAVLCGCASKSPVIPDLDDNSIDTSFAPTLTPMNADVPYKLWGLWKWHVSEDHSSVELTPLREVQFHMNALRFLEDGPCYDCVRIESVSPGVEPGTVDVEVTIRNPFPFGQLEYVAFDVKGILCFPATYTCATTTAKGEYPQYNDFSVPIEERPTYISWREWGDPEVLNPDGYSYRWSPAYMAEGMGGTQPIFQYWPGKFASGLPNAHINAHINYFTHEDRHMFYPGLEVTHTYTIWLPPGPVEAAYAVEACWELPVNIPVTYPAGDFPITANQPEPYYLKFNLNNGQPIKEKIPDCCGWYYNGTKQSVEFERRYGDYPPHMYLIRTYHNYILYVGEMIRQCETPSDYWCVESFYPGAFQDGKYRMLVHTYDYAYPATNVNLAFTVCDFEIDLQ